MKSYHNRRARAVQTISNEEETRILLYILNPDFICRMETHAEHCATKHICGKKGGTFVFPELYYKPLQAREQAHSTRQVLDGSMRT